jgi:hypothetical protein
MAPAARRCTSREKEKNFACAVDVKGRRENLVMRGSMRVIVNVTVKVNVNVDVTVTVNVIIYTRPPRARCCTDDTRRYIDSLTI